MYSKMRKGSSMASTFVCLGRFVSTQCNRRCQRITPDTISVTCRLSLASSASMDRLNPTVASIGV